MPGEGLGVRQMEHWRLFSGLSSHGKACYCEPGILFDTTITWVAGGSHTTYIYIHDSTLNISSDQEMSKGRNRSYHEVARDLSIYSSWHKQYQRDSISVTAKAKALTNLIDWLCSSEEQSR